MRPVASGVCPRCKKCVLVLGKPLKIQPTRKRKPQMSIKLATIKAILAATITLFGVGVSNAAPSCIPGFKSQTTVHPARFIVGDNGLHVFWWCPGPDGRPLENGASCGKYGGCALAFAKFMSSDFNAGNDFLWDKNVTWVCNANKSEENSDDGRLCKERLNLLAINSPTWLPATPYVEWRVKTNGGSPDRPAYSFINGALGIISNYRATVGTSCDLTKATAPAPYTLTSKDIRAQWLGGPDGVVTLCTKVVP